MEKDESHEEGPPKKRLRAYTPDHDDPLQYKACCLCDSMLFRGSASLGPQRRPCDALSSSHPKIFSQVHKDTLRRWPQQIGKEKGKPGPKPKFDEAEIALIASSCRSLTDKIAVSARVLAGVATNILQDAGSDKVMHVEMMRRLCQEWNLTWRRGASVTEKKISDVDAIGARRLLQQKIEFLLSEYNIDRRRIWNFDETAVNVLPLAQAGWRAPGSKRAREIFSDKRQITVLLCMPYVFGPLRAQLIFEGKTDACLPSSGADLPGLSCTHTESHWSSQDTLVDAAILIDQAMNPEGEKQDWLLLLDMASTHTGEHFRKRMREEYPWVHCVATSRLDTPVCASPLTGLSSAFGKRRCAGSPSISRDCIDSSLKGRPF